MSTAKSSRPTLWRTCRVLANRGRLEALALLFRQPGQTVSAVAERRNLSLSAASENLRALEARGFLTARRNGRHVFYRPAQPAEADARAQLILALRATFARDNEAVEKIFKLATAFTHARRVEIFRAVQSKPGTFCEIAAATRVPAAALYRHLRKLESRGLVEWHSDRCVATPGVDALRRSLARLVAE